MNLTPIEFLSLVPEFRGESWRGWRSVIAAMFGLAPEDPDLVRRVTGRATLPTAPSWETYVIGGRGLGKSRVGSAIGTYFGTREYERAAGEQIYVVILAPDRRQAAVTYRYVSGLLQSVPALASLVANETRDTIDLTTGVTIQVTTADYRTVRGRSVACAIVEEGAFLPTDNSATPDTELLRALRPALARVPGSMLLFVSSPYARRGELWRAYRNHFGKDGDTLVVKAPTLLLNPTFDPRAIDKAYEDDPIAAAAEYGAEFRSDVEAFISREALDDCVDGGVRERAPVSGVRYRAFVDPSGGSADAFTLAVAHTEGDTEVVDAVRVRQPPFSPEQCVEEFAAFLKTYRVTEVVGDKYAGEWPREQFRKRGVVYKPAERTRSELYLELLPLVNARRVRLLDVAQPINELAALERRTGRGRDVVDHAPGGHDDAANAVAGALTLNAAGPEIRIRRVTPHDAIEAARLRNADPSRRVQDEIRRLERKLGY